MFASSQTLKRRLNAIAPSDSLEYSIRNIKVNASNHGCSGFIRNKLNGVVIYVTTDINCMGTNTVMIRYARDFKDFTGCQNFFTTEEKFAVDAYSFLSNQEAFKRALVARHKI